MIRVLERPSEPITIRDEDLANWPLLRLAYGNRRRADRTTLEWPVGEESWKNYMQIARTVIFPDRESFDSKLRVHFDEIEKILWYGTPSRAESDVCPITTCGGVLHYLGRNPVKCDRISLRFLRAPTLLFNREEPGRETRDEIITEFSLMVEPAEELVPLG